MSEIPPIGLPNLVSQGDIVARARAAKAGSERAGNDVIAQELQRLAELRAEQVQRMERLATTRRQRRERERERIRTAGTTTVSDADDEDEASTYWT